MGFPWRSITATAALTAYLATSTKSKSAFAAYFAGIWFLGLSCWAFWAVILYPKLFSPHLGLPEPKNKSWFNGQFQKIRHLPTGAPMQEWMETVPNDGIIRYLGLLNQERLLITSPKALAEVLVTRNYDFHKPSQVVESIGRILGRGVLLVEGEEHKTQRKNLMPAFAFRHVKDLYPVFWDKAREGVLAMTKEILAEAAKEPPATHDPEKGPNNELDGKTAVIEVGGWLSRTTLDIIGVAGMGRDFGAIADPDNKLFQTYNHLFKPSREAQVLALVGAVLPTWFLNRLPVRRNGDVHRAAETIRETCRDLIREKKAKIDRKEPTGVDILSVALGSGGFGEDGLVDQLMTFLAAGHETTASAMTWAVYLLCRFPDVQARLRREVRAALPPLGGGGRPVSSLDVDRMPYLNAVCSEVLRYFSPVPMTLREAVCDTTIQGHRVPRGTRIIIAAAATNRDPGLWGPDAKSFNPERWLPESEGDRKRAASGGASSNYAFMTFLHGPRSCIGMNFARAEFACLLAAWIGRVEFSLRNKEEMDEAKLDIKAGVTARPAKGLYVYARVLDGW